MRINNTIHKSILLSASLSVIWRKWTTPEGLKTFFGVDNRVELQLGGAYEILFLMDAPKGEQGGEGNQILSFLPEQMLTFSWNAPPTIPEVRNHAHKTWVVLQFKPTDPDKTELTLDHLGWLEGDKWDEAYAYFDNAWDFVLQSLRDSL